MKSSLRRLALVLLVSAVSGCATWKPVERDRIATALDEKPGRVLVATDKATLDLVRPELRSDTLYAYRPSTNRSVSIPISSVESLSVWRVDRNRTRSAVGIALFATVFLVAVMTMPKSVVDH